VSTDDLGLFSRRFAALQRNVEQAILGKADAVRLALTCMLCEGHLLIEDVPGVGKTSLARAIAASIDGSWHRIQFTPDLVPSDVTGVSIFNQATRTFEFHPGGVFANLVVADEINRASPKTQSALLEVMEERHVTVDAIPYAVPRPFMVIATQNPVDMEGTYPLPEAQLDRFLMRSALGYPDRRSEVEILVTQGRSQVVDHLTPVISSADLAHMIESAAALHVSPAIQDYIVAVVAGTRDTPGIHLGASPRASLALQRASRVWAASEGRSYVTPEDVKAMAPSVLAHRLILDAEAELQGRKQIQLVEQVLRSLPVPRALANP
jgi:MoxR-like ATPase